MNCREALAKIYEFLDKDGTIPLKEIETHLDWCRPCWDRFEFEKQLKALVQKSCCKETCPDSLKEKIKTILEKY
jgi:mycothiol system anti-sigma-R factor